MAMVEEDVLFVALGKEVKKNETVLMWALHHLRGRRICILHVHQPAQEIRIMGTKMSISRLEGSHVTAYHEEERKEMIKILDKYIQTCQRTGVHAEKMYLETLDSIEEGIVKLVSDHGIKSLVIGTTSYSRSTREPGSRKAIHVRAEAPASCHISFICKGVLILTRERNLGGNYLEVETRTLQASPNVGANNGEVSTQFSLDPEGDMDNTGSTQ